MAVKSRKSLTGQRVHFFARFVGLTGALAAGVGAFVWKILGNEEIGAIVVALGLSAVAFGLLFELFGVARAISSRRGAFGLNVALQVIVMFALVAGVNVFSFENYRRLDLTRDHLFTLDPAIAKQLAELRGDTEIIVLQQYVSFGQRAENKQDKYDFAAQRKIVEKVKDLVDQFRDFSPRFRVTILDVQEDHYQAKLDQVLAAVSTRPGDAVNDSKKPAELSDFAKEVNKAIETAPENSIFFVSKEHKKIQRLSFSDIYQLDKQSSIESNNLVLKFQGTGPFARKIFNIEEKRPHVALAVVHPWLGSQNAELPMYTMAGAKKVLDAYGFECGDIMLRKLTEDGRLTGDATVLTYDESRYEQLEDDLIATDEVIEENRQVLTEMQELLKFWTASSLAALNKKYVYVRLADGRQGVQLRTEMDRIKKSGIPHKFDDVDEEDRTNKTALYKHNADMIKHLLDSQRDERKSLQTEQDSLKADSLAEKRRLTDLEAKMKAMLANVDLLIVPRTTLRNAPAKDAIPNRLHRLDAAQFNAVKAFLKQGKPILFLLGPPNVPSEFQEIDSPVDDVESMLAELGFVMPKQVILYNLETKEYNQRKFGGEFDRSKREVEVPGLKFDDSTITFPMAKGKPTLNPQPIRESLRLMNRALGSKSSQEVRVRHPRPIYFVRSASPEGTARIIGNLALPGTAGPVAAATALLNKTQQRPDENAVFLLTREECWNEENPFIVKTKVPRYTPTKDDDPKKGTLEEERLGPFPIGVAAEVTLPGYWRDKDKANKDAEPSKAPAQAAKARVAVIGSGSVFVGPSLPPLKEKMLLDVVNWLIGRDDLLAKDAETWHYPRVELTPVEFNLWQWGARLGLPLVFIYLGTIVWNVRRMR